MGGTPSVFVGLVSFQGKHSKLNIFILKISADRKNSNKNSEFCYLNETLYTYTDFCLVCSCLISITVLQKINLATKGHTFSA